MLTVKQVGNDVVVSGSGSANIESLPDPDRVNDYTNVLTDSQIYAGPAAFSGGTTPVPPVDVYKWSGLLGPSSFGNDINIRANPDSGEDDFFGIVADNQMGQSLLVLPLNYTSGDPLKGTSRFIDFTLAELGLSPGVFSWSWGTNGNADSLELKIEAVPVPAPLPLAGVAIAWRLAKRMRGASRRQGRQNSLNPPIKSVNAYGKVRNS